MKPIRPTPAAAISEAQRKMNAQLGISDEQFLKHTTLASDPGDSAEATAVFHQLGITAATFKKFTE